MGDAYIETVEESSRRSFQYRIITLAGAGVFLDGYDLFIISVALILLKPYFALSTTQLALLSSSALIGAVIGPILFGNLADRLGRKRLFLIDLLFFVVFAAASAFAANFYELVIFRLLLGIGIGADYPVSSSYVAEFVGAQKRGRALASTFAFQGVGVLSAIVVGLALLGTGPNGWRWMLLSGVAPAVIVLLFRTRLPETLRWYLSKGKTDEAGKVIHEMTGEKEGTSEIMAVAQSTSAKELIVSPYRLRLFFASVSWFLVDIAVYGIGIYTPTFIHELYGANSPPTSNELAYAVIYAFAGVGYGLAVLSIDRIGRKPLQIGGFLVMGLALLIGALAGSSLSLFGLSSVLAVFYVAENMGPNTTTWVYPVELFPTRIRGTGHGFAATVGKLGAVAGVYALPLLLALDRSVMLLFVALAAFAGAAVTVALGIETKKQSLENVSEVFSSFYNYISSLSDKLVKSALELHELFYSFDRLGERYAAIKQVEHEGDEIVHEVFTKLNRSYAAPIDQAEISALTKSLDDVLDTIHAVAVRVSLYKLDAPTPEMRSMSDIILESVNLIRDSVSQMPSLRGSNSIMARCVRINELENEGDSLLNESVARLYELSDPVKIMKLKEVYEYMEIVTDRCEDVADVFRDLVVKYS